MALIKCKECNKEISDTAKICIHCGAKTEKAQKRNKSIIKYIAISISIILIISIIVISNIITTNNNPLNRYKTQTKKIINNYLNNEITVDIAKKQIENIKNQVDSDYDENKDSEYLYLSIKLSSIEWELTKLTGIYGNVSKLKEFTEDL